MQSKKISWIVAIRRTLFATALAVLSNVAFADSDYTAEWGPSVGSMAPMLSAVDQDGNRRDMSSLSGSEGLLFIFNRSVDW